MESPVASTQSFLPTPVADYDGAWKEALELYLMGLMSLCFPTIAALIDWDAGFVFMDKELEAIMRDAELGRQHVDKLAKVRLRSGLDQMILFHIEVASQEYVPLELTMYQYHHRLEDRYKLPVLSVAVLGDESETWRPHVYENEVLGCRVRFEFPTCKLLDFRSRWAELEAHPHPAALIIMAHLRALETRKDMDRRFTLRRELTRLLYGKGFGRKDVLEIMRMLDWLMTLPPEMTLANHRWVVEFEKENAMPFVTSFERISREEGLQEGLRRQVFRQLRKQIGDLDDATLNIIKDLSAERLEDLGEALLGFKRMSDLEVWLQAAC